MIMCSVKKQIQKRPLLVSPPSSAPPFFLYKHLLSVSVSFLATAVFWYLPIKKALRFCCSEFRYYCLLVFAVRKSTSPLSVLPGMSSSSISALCVHVYSSVADYLLPLLLICVLCRNFCNCTFALLPVTYTTDLSAWTEIFLL